MADTFTQADIDAAVAAANTSNAAAVTTARAEGVTAERTRITGILASEQGVVRPIAALAAALETDMSLEQATAFLGKLAEEPKAVAPATAPGAGAPAGMFESAMANTANPNITAETGEGEDEDDAMIAQSFGGRRQAKK